MCTFIFFTLILSQYWQLSDQLCYCLCKNYGSFWFGRNSHNTNKRYSMLQITASSPPSVWRIIVREWKKRRKEESWGERSCPRLHNLMSKNHRSWRLVGRRRFHQTHANPSALHRNKRLDVICPFLASQQREGWRKAGDRVVEYNTGMLCLAAKGVYAEKVGLVHPPLQGTHQFRSHSPCLL